MCKLVDTRRAEIPCTVSETPMPFTKIQTWLKLNASGSPSSVESTRFSIIGANSSMPILTIDPFNCMLANENNYSILSENILGVSQPYYYKISGVVGNILLLLQVICKRFVCLSSILDSEVSSDCQVINDKVRLTCSFRFHTSSAPITSIYWSIDNNKIKNKTTTTEFCRCLITSTVIVSLQDVIALTSCAALLNNKPTIQYPYRPCGLVLFSFSV